MLVRRVVYRDVCIERVIMANCFPECYLRLPYLAEYLASKEKGRRYLSPMGSQCPSC
jgi:hypothetical protein